ncbi:hypothetical protein J2Y54_002315 [Sphingomonas sp. BE123]|uniref:hypothetical protein n=1 Tax=Sphingomonas sp. BE123 TaxID=2817842 RepID=UPI002860114C|nr:hypothetical protein [Sphingomonas sp. BE123]MDR6852795.1 hypothetical protein [Sphingomonas sp. BE123]
MSSTTAYRSGLALFGLTAFLIVWTTIVRDDGSGAGNFMIILAAVVGGYAVRFDAAGLARAMAGVATMQLILGLLTATAPITATLDSGAPKAFAFHAVFMLFWLASAMLFRFAGRGSLAAR